MRKLVSAAAAALALVVSAPAAAADLIVSNGLLMGATGVNVGGTLYDVSFVDNTCSTIFTGCDSVSDFDFQTEASAIVAARALLDQVFIDGPQGNFDKFSNTTNGCTNTAGCVVIIPYTMVGSLFSPVYAENDPATTTYQDDVLSFHHTFASSFDTRNDITSVYAKFTLAAAAPVPEPATWAMMLLGFGGIGMAMRRRKALAFA